VGRRRFHEIEKVIIVAVVTSMFLHISEHYKAHLGNPNLSALKVNPLWSKLLKEFPELKIHEVAYYCEKLKDHGHLSRINSLGGPFSDGYFPIRQEERTNENIEYGILDFLVLGFQYIRDSFKNSVLPILVGIENNGSINQDIGTCFLFNKKYVVTAKHCVEKAISISLISDNKIKSSLNFIHFPRNTNGESDLAILEFDGEVFDDQKSFQLSQGSILEPILTMGYPPIPGFSDPPIQVAETAQVAGQLKSTTGSIIGSGHSYLDNTHPLLISARVKGGNSGGPVINQMGRVIGVVSSMPADADGKLDSLGYGVVTPAPEILRLLERISSQDNDLARNSFERFGDEFRLTNSK
jgi:serine protease Do